MNSLNKRLKKAEPEAFVELYDQLGDRIFRYAVSQTGNSTDASDVTQEVFLRLVKSHRSLAKADNLTAYVFSIARTETIRWLKKQRRANTERATRLEHGTELSGKEDGATSIESNEWVTRTMSRLEPVTREIVYLKVYCQLTFREIGDVLDLNHSTVATRYRRAISKMETQLQSENSSSRGSGYCHE